MKLPVIKYCDKELYHFILSLKGHKMSDNLTVLNGRHCYGHL